MLLSQEKQFPKDSQKLLPWHPRKSFDHRRRLDVAGEAYFFREKAAVFVDRHRLIVIH
jgi:hypothetical protein